MSPVQDIMGTRENSITIEEPIVPVNNAMALFEAAKNVPADETPAGYEYVEKVFCKWAYIFIICRESAL